MTLKYPKIETLFVRDKDTFTVTDELRLPEFAIPKFWHVTEKIDGTNVIVTYKPEWEETYDDRYVNEDGASSTHGEKTRLVPACVRFNGRNGSSQLPGPLLKHMEKVITAEALTEIFGAIQSEVTLFGEGYGPGIQKGGGNYRADVSFRLFDVNFGGDLWLNWDNITDIARKLDIDTAPVLTPAASLTEVINLVNTFSRTAKDEGGPGCMQEGIVARTNPYLLTRRGERLMFKLKVSDYNAGKR